MRVGRAIASSLFVCVGLLMASVIALATSSVLAADFDMRTGSFEGWFCGAPATFEVHEKYPDAWVFRGSILIRDTGEYDAIRIDQFDDNSLRITRELSGANFGSKQSVETDPPVIEEGNVVFYSGGGRGPGCNNAGANTALRIPLEPAEDPLLEFDLNVVGKSPQQCEESNSRCSNRMQVYGADAALQIQLQCTPRFQACMGNAVAALNQLEANLEVTGDTPEQCFAASRDCETSMMAQGLNANDAAGVCTPRYQACMANLGGGGGGGGDVRTVGAGGTTVYEDPDAKKEKDYLDPGVKVTVVGCPNWSCEITAPIAGFVDENDLN